MSVSGSAWKINEYRIKSSSNTHLNFNLPSQYRILSLICTQGWVLGQAAQPEGPHHQQLGGGGGDGHRGEGGSEGRLPPLHPGRGPGEEDQRADRHQHRDTRLQPRHPPHHPHKTGEGIIFFGFFQRVTKYRYFKNTKTILELNFKMFHVKCFKRNNYWKG